MESRHPQSKTWLPLTLVVCSLLVLLFSPFFVGPGSWLRRNYAAQGAATAAERVAVLTAELDAERARVLGVLDGGNRATAVAHTPQRGDARRVLESLGALPHDEAIAAQVDDVREDAREFFTVVDSLTGSRAPRTARGRGAAAIRLTESWANARRSSDALRISLLQRAGTNRWVISAPMRSETILRFLLVFIALSSSLVVSGIERRSRIAARDAERARRERTALLDSSSEGIFGADRSGVCTFMNRAGAQLLGYAPEELIGRRVHDVIHSRRRDGSPYDWFTCPTCRALASGECVQAEDEVFWTREAGALPVELSAAPVQEDGEIRGIVVNFKDISARKRAEAEREELLRRERSARAYAEAAEARARSLAHASRLFADSLDYETTVRSLAHVVVPAVAESCVIYLIDDDYRIHRMEPMHRDPVRQAILRERLERCPPEIDHLEPAVRQALVEGTPSVVSRVAAAGAPEGEDDLSPRSMVVVPLRARNRILGALTYGSSTSGSYSGEDDLRFAEELANRAALAMDNARLYGASQQAVREKNDVLGFVSHDLRSPLQAIRTGAQALVRHWPPVGDGALEREQLAVICRSAERMGNLIRDLLHIAQIESGRLSIVPQPVAARHAVDEALQTMEPVAREAGVLLRNRVPSGLPPLHADGGRLLQVFTNLLSNAVRFTPPGEEIVVTARAEGDRVRFSVADAGPGIPEEERPFLFDRYWQAKNRKRGGAGLGLAIARGFVEGHGGEISVETAPGAGTVFFFSIPVATETEPSAAPELHFSLPTG